MQDHLFCYSWNDRCSLNLRIQVIGGYKLYTKALTASGPALCRLKLRFSNAGPITLQSKHWRYFVTNAYQIQAVICAGVDIIRIGYNIIYWMNNCLQCDKVSGATQNIDLTKISPLLCKNSWGNGVTFHLMYSHIFYKYNSKVCARGAPSLVTRCETTALLKNKSFISNMRPKLAPACYQGISVTDWLSKLLFCYLNFSFD